MSFQVKIKFQRFKFTYHVKFLYFYSKEKQIQKRIQ